MKNYTVIFFVLCSFYGNISQSSHADPLAGIVNKSSDIDFSVDRETQGQSRLRPSANSAFQLVMTLDAKTEKKETVSIKAIKNKALRIVYPKEKVIKYLKRVKHYEENVFKRPLTGAEKQLYCGHLLEK